MAKEPKAATRRRGPELDAALLDSAWDELVEVGFVGLTMESVAARAQTGVAVLYRRWPNKGELVLAAITHRGETHPIEIPDTGTLRGDLIAALRNFGEARAGFVGVAAASFFSGLLDVTGLSPTEARERFLGDQLKQPTRREIIYGRAADRGEIDLAKVPSAVLDVPFDLVRHDMLMNLEPPSKKRIEAIVDEIFLPLVRPAARS